jgi:hypothetical protein
VTDVGLPFMRLDVMDAVHSLATAERQAVWLEPRPDPTGPMESFDLDVHILYDDSRVLPDPRPHQGTVLFPDEIGPMEALGQALTPLIETLGDEDDAAYLRHPRWRDVMTAAESLLKVMRRNGPASLGDLADRS